LEKKILYINPVRSDDPQELKILSRVVETRTQLEYRSLGTGPEHLEYKYYRAVILPMLLQMIKRAEQEEFDAVVISCFLDPGVEEGRELTEGMIIVGPGEASMHIAATLGEAFSILVTHRNIIPEITRNLDRFGLKGKLASFRSINMGVLELQQDKETVFNRFKKVAREAIEHDGAEVIVLGCTGAYGFYERLQRALGVPVVDPGIAALKFAEFLVGLKKQFEWSHTKIGSYKSPPKEEILEWGLGEAEVWQ